MTLRRFKIRLTPTVLPTLAALAAFCLTAYLGHWQQGRAAEKTALQTEIESRGAATPFELGADIVDPLAMTHARATAHGEWHASGQFFLDNKFDQDSVGFHVITPLRIKGTNRYVLVNRGWVARGSGYPVPPAVFVPQGPVTVEGVLAIPSTRFLELSQATIQDNVWQNLTVERYRQLSGRDVLPLILLERGGGGSLKPVLERPDDRAEKHVEYMLTWYSLAVTVVVLWLTLNITIERVPPTQLPAERGHEW